MQISDNTKKILSIGLAILVLLTILILIDWVLVYQFRIFGHLILLLLVIIALKTLIRLFVFPGSFQFWRRNVENRYAKALAKRAHKRVQDATNILDKLIHQKNSEINLEDIGPIRKTIESFINTFQGDLTLNKHQQELLQLLLQVEECFRKVILDNQNLFDLLEQPQLVMDILKRNLSIPNDGNSMQLFEILGRIEQILLDIYGPKGTWKSIERWYSNRILGTANQMRSELQNTFKSKRYYVKSFDDKIIDCLLLIAENDDNINDQIQSVVLFCQPNAGYYEYMYYESDWIEYYMKRKISIFLWNYRGYGDSEGLPQTKDILQDGEYLVDFIQKELKIPQLILHGESLGGMIACHLGKTRQATLLFADRTFASISEIATVGFSKYARFFFNLLTSWNYDSGQAFVDCNYYKIVAMDCRDEVIPYLSSLKVAIGRSIFLKEYSLNDESFRVEESRHRFQFFEKWSRKCRFMFHESAADFVNLWHSQILSKQDTQRFFLSIQRMQDLMRDLSMDRRKKTLDDSLNTSNVMDKSLNESVEINQTKDNDDEVKTTTTYQNTNFQNYQLSPSDRSSEVFQKFMLKLFEYFETLETTGLTLNDIFQNYPKHQQFPIFQDYLLSIFLWGSYLPIKNIARKKMTTIVCQKLAYAKISTCLTKIENLVKQEKNHFQSPTQLSMLQDLDFMIHKFRVVRENFKKAQRNKNSQVSIEMTEEGSKQQNKQAENVNKNYGCFIPLTCGHNGILAALEVDALDFHMAQAGIIQ